MLEITKSMLLLIGLLYFAWQDYKTGYIRTISAVIVGIIGIVLTILIERNVDVMWMIVASMLIGIGLMLVGVFSKESIGIGDGILFLVSGCYLNIFENLILLRRTIFLIGGFAILCLTIKKLRKTSQIPMAPFMLTAYVTTFLN